MIIAIVSIAVGTIVVRASIWLIADIIRSTRRARALDREAAETMARIPEKYK